MLGRRGRRGYRAHPSGDPKRCHWPCGTTTTIPASSANDPAQPVNLQPVGCQFFLKGLEFITERMRPYLARNGAKHENADVRRRQDRGADDTDCSNAGGSQVMEPRPKSAMLRL